MIAGESSEEAAARRSLQEVECETTPADVLTPAQGAVVLQSFSTACPEPAGGWTAATAAQYTCSEDCARVFVTAYNDCRTSYMERVAAAPDAHRSQRDLRKIARPHRVR